MPSSGCRRRADQVENLEHLVVVADDIAKPEPHVELLFQRLVFEQQRLLPGGFLDDDADLFIDDRLGQVIECADFRGFDGTLRSSHSW